ncbi:MAG: AAA family ATPase [Lachnospiraceae bacterium]|nr:AAA family ATPase [Lachnospiraceae bacterium]
MELERDIYQELIKWKKRDSGKVLELKGARQTGKTFILDKFARENYKQYLYINMAQSSGEEFMTCVEEAEVWSPGQPRVAKTLHRALQLFDSRFQDDKDTIIIIDEIQESSKIYSRIREFAREFQCHVIVTGSYLGKTVEKEYFLPAGDTEDLIMDTLSFEEFLGAMGKRDVYESIDLYGGDRHDLYDELKRLYDVYCEIGGYPAVVKQYLETKNKADCKRILRQVIRIFIEESTRYFQGIPDVNLFEQIFPAIAQLSAREKKGADDLIAELSKIIFKEESNRTTKRSINNAVAWLYRSDIIGYCGKAVECDSTDTRANMRFYFRDLGVADFFLKTGGIKSAALAGYINENFVYLDLLKRCRRMEIAGMAPMFGTYKTGEIDFFVSSIANDKDYGVEVKAGDAAAKTAHALLRDGRVEAVYFLKGGTYGGCDGRSITIPIYLVQRVEFNFERSRRMR